MTDTPKKKRQAGLAKAREAKKAKALADKHKLAVDEQRFVIEYIKDFNCTQAAYRAKISKSHGHLMLKKPHVKKAVEEACKDLIKRLKVSADRVVVEISKIAFADPDPEIGVRASDKLKALELLGKHFSLFSDKVEVEHSGKVESGERQVNINLFDAAGREIDEDGETEDTQAPTDG